MFGSGKGAGRLRWARTRQPNLVGPRRATPPCARERPSGTAAQGETRSRCAASSAPGATHLSTARGSPVTMTVVPDRATSAPVTHEEIFAAHRGGKLATGMTAPLSDARELAIAY